MDNVQMIRGQAAQIQMEKKKLPAVSRLSSPLVSALTGGWLLAVAPVLQSWWGLTRSHTAGMPALQDPQPALCHAPGSSMANSRQPAHSTSLPLLLSHSWSQGVPGRRGRGVPAGWRKGSLNGCRV